MTTSTNTSIRLQFTKQTYQVLKATAVQCGLTIGALLQQDFGTLGGRISDWNAVQVDDHALEEVSTA